jgi:hypothetical protein
MKQFAIVAAIPLLAGYLCAAPQATQTETTTTTTINGTLLDQGCVTTHTKETSSNEASQTEVNRYVTECPVTTSSTTFSLLTPEGKIVRFDDESNARVVEMVKGNKHWTTYITERKPIKVHVVGSHKGEFIVVKTIQ